MKKEILELRRSEPKDVNEVLGILYENSRWLDSLGIFQWPFEWLKAQEADLVRDAKDGHFYVYEDSNSVLGVVHLTKDTNSLWSHLGESDDAYYLSKFAIRRCEAGKGLGSSMLESIERIVINSGTERLRLDCVSNNQTLKAYYEKRNFRFVAQCKMPAVSLDLYEKRLQC